MRTLQRACLSKVEYRTRKLAREAAEHLRGREPTLDPLVPYHCPYGAHYHLTHNRRRSTLLR
jgi:hypothetical protein